MNIAKYGMQLMTAVALVAAIAGCATRPALAPIPAVPLPQAQNSVPMGDLRSFPEMKLDIPVAQGRSSRRGNPSRRIIPANRRGCARRNSASGFTSARNPPARAATGMRAISTSQARPIEIMSGDTAIHRRLATRKSCAIGIPPSSIPPRSRRYTKMPARGS